MENKRYTEGGRERNGEREREGGERLREGGREGGRERERERERKRERERESTINSNRWTDQADKHYTKGKGERDKYSIIDRHPRQHSVQQTSLFLPYKHIHVYPNYSCYEVFPHAA